MKVGLWIIYCFCSAANGPNKTVAEWTSKLDIPYDVYHAIAHTDSVRPKQFHSNHGNEAGSYLKYIVEHYDCLAEVNSPSILTSDLINIVLIHQLGQLKAMKAHSYTPY